MNCQEVQALVEEAIENRLSASCRRKVNLHLSRCAECRAFLAAEQTEHAAWFRALNDVSDIPPPATSSAALASRLAATAIPAAKRAGSIIVPLWLKRAAAIMLLCGGAALAAWIGTTMESRNLDDNGLASRSPSGDSDWDSRHLGGETLPLAPASTPTPEGEPQVKRTLLAATATIALAATPAQGTSSAEATFDSFSSEFRTSASAEAMTFLSRFRTVEYSDALSSFDSREPQGLIIVIH